MCIKDREVNVTGFSLSAGNAKPVELCLIVIRSFQNFFLHERPVDIICLTPKS